MSGSSAAQPNSSTAKAATSDATQIPHSKAEQQPQKQVEEDDEFEDFPVEDWGDEDTDMAAGGGDGSTHLWEESWDDDDQSEDFAKMLQEELKKVNDGKS